MYHTIKSSNELQNIPRKYDVSDITEHYLDTGEYIGLLQWLTYNCILYTISSKGVFFDSLRMVLRGQNIRN